MTDNQIRIAYLVKKLRYKYRDDKEKNSALDRILWWSYQVVYCDDVFNGDWHKIHIAMERRKEKKKRVNRYLRDMADFYENLHFVTLTFNDESLQKLSEKTRHRYAQAWLNENCRDYFANVDYGKKNGREHFHAVVALKDTTEPWKYGYMGIKKAHIGTEFGDRNKVSSYMLKLTNHSTKFGTGKSFRKKQREEVDKLPF